MLQMSVFVDEPRCFFGFHNCPYKACQVYMLNTKLK